MSFVDQDDVPAARSSFSHRSTDQPRPAASRAIPQPLIPPPIMAMSKERFKLGVVPDACALLSILFRSRLYRNKYEIKTIEDVQLWDALASSEAN